MQYTSNGLEVLNGKRECFDFIHLREGKETPDTTESDILIFPDKCAAHELPKALSIPSKTRVGCLTCHVTKQISNVRLQSNII